MLLEIIAAAIAVGTLFGMVIKAAQYVLRSFHNEHVAPSIAQVTETIMHNTSATSGLTSALAETNKRQQAGFDRMGDIIADHEKQLGIHATRLDYHDEALASARRPMVAKGTARPRKP